jgi:hypothetical protein
MTNCKKFIGAIVCIFILLPTLGMANEAASLKKKIIFDQKKLLVMQNMEFSADEVKFFWPIYEDLQEELFAANQRVAKLVLAYASAYQALTDEQAKIIVDEFLDVKKARLNILEKYMAKLAKGLPAKKVFRYLRVENKLVVMAEYEISKQVPLAQ